MFVTAVDPTGAPTSSAHLPPGSGAWSDLSDREAKENFQVVDSQQVLEELSRVPISTWNYKAQGKQVRHMGPMAQDFYAAFGMGEDDRHITTVDSDGVALAAIQGLYQLLQERVREMEELEKAHIYIEQLHDKNKSLEARLLRVEEVLGSRADK